MAAKSPNSSELGFLAAAAVGDSPLPEATEDVLDCLPVPPVRTCLTRPVLTACCIVYVLRPSSYCPRPLRTPASSAFCSDMGGCSEAAPRLSTITVADLASMWPPRTASLKVMPLPQSAS